jgi:DNA-binding NarL/FixJ family response regulator
VESHEIYLRGLVAVLTEAAMTVVVADVSLGGFRQALADVVVIDADTTLEPGGAEVIARIAHATPVLVLTSHSRTGATDDRLTGVTGFLDRGVTVEALLATVQAAASGTAPPATAAARSPGVPAAPEVVDTLRPDPGLGVLSKREYQVLWQIAEGRTQGQIARALGISHHTVDSYLRRIRAKLGLGNKAELTRAAMLGQFDPGRGRPEGRSVAVGRAT